MNGESIGFIGGGRITRIILGGLAYAGRIPIRVVISDPNVSILNDLKETFPAVQIAPSDNQASASQDIVFVGVHPPAMSSVLSEVRTCLHPDSLVVSLAPKISIARISASLNGFSRIARLIPNAPSIVGRGYNPVAFSASFTPAEKSALLTLLSALGQSPEVAEDKLEAYAILTAMGPTYLWFQLYELESIVESFGLTQEESRTGITEMVMGAVETMYKAGLQPHEVMELVPVKPLGEDEDAVKSLYHARLEALFSKLKS